MLLPDLCNRLQPRTPADASTPEPRAFARLTEPGGRGYRLRDAAPARPCGPPASIGFALDGALPASVVVAGPTAWIGATPIVGATSPRRFRPRARPAKTSPLTPVMSRPRDESRGRGSELLRMRSRQRARRRDSKGCLPSTGALHDASRESRKPVTDVAVLPPRPGFRRALHPSAATHGGARPIHASERSSRPRAMGRTSPVDFCRRNELRASPRTARTPHHPTAGGPAVQLFVPGRSLDRPATADGDCPYSGNSQPRCFGPGTWPGSLTLPARHSNAAIARDDDFAPTRLARAPLVAACIVARVENPRPWRSLAEIAVCTPPGPPQSGELSGRLCARLHKEERVETRPKVPSVVGKTRVLAKLSPSCPQPVEYG